MLAQETIAKAAPLPNLVGTKPPIADTDIVSILGKDFPTKGDEELRRIQAPALAACAPITNLWSQMASQGFSGKQDEVIPTSDVITVMRETLGNASAYISQARRKAIIAKVKIARPQLATFMKESCKEESAEPHKELFGADLKKRLSERAEWWGRPLGNVALLGLYSMVLRPGLPLYPAPEPPPPKTEIPLLGGGRRV